MRKHCPKRNCCSSLTHLLLQDNYPNSSLRENKCRAWPGRHNPNETKQRPLDWVLDGSWVRASRTLLHTLKPDPYRAFEFCCVWKASLASKPRMSILNEKAASIQHRHLTQSIAAKMPGKVGRQKSQQPSRTRFIFVCLGLGT